MVKVLLHENSATWEFKELAARSFFNHIHLSSGLTAEREGFDKAKSSETEQNRLLQFRTEASEV